MIRLILITAFLFLNLDARENPFFPSSGEKDLPNTTNKDLSVSPLKRAALSLPSSARRVQKVTIEYKNLDGSIEKKDIELNNAIDWHLPIFISQSMGDLTQKTVSKKTTSTKYKHLYTSKNVKFYQKDKELKIVSNDKILRDFLVTNPYKLVIDFKKDVNLKSETKNLNTPVFKKIVLGTHDGYYRAVITLDGQYKYSKVKKPYGYVIQLY